MGMQFFFSVPSLFAQYFRSHHCRFGGIEHGQMYHMQQSYSRPGFLGNNSGKFYGIGSSFRKIGRANYIFHSDKILVEAIVIRVYTGFWIRNNIKLLLYLIF
jgi:hypothetical protein